MVSLPQVLTYVTLIKRITCQTQLVWEWLIAVFTLQKKEDIHAPQGCYMPLYEIALDINLQEIRVSFPTLYFEHRLNQWKLREVAQDW